MNDSNLPSTPSANRLAWNKGKLTGPKPPLRPGHVWLIRAKLQLERRTRDLALFNLAIDSKLRGCDLVALCVDDVAPNATPSTAPTFASERRAGLSGSAKAFYNVCHPTAELPHGSYLGDVPARRAF
jgi:hypothetical protein